MFKKKLESDYTQHKKELEEKSISCKEKDIMSKRKAWQKFLDTKEESIGGNSHLLKFHVDELIHAEKKNDEDKYDYMIELCSFVKKIEETGKSDYINIPYDYKSTVFPIIIMNQERRNLLQGTVEVESQSVVKFTGVSLQNANFNNIAENIYKAYCK